LVGLEPQEIAGLASESATKLFKNIRPVHTGTVMVKTQQRGIGNAGFLPEFVEGPPSAFEDLGKRVDDHAYSMLRLDRASQVNLTYKLYFTQTLSGSTLAVVPSALLFIGRVADLKRGESLAR